MQKLFSPKIEGLIESLKVLPGVGKKTAQRMAIQLLDKKQQAAHELAQAIENALDAIKHCQQCNMLCEDDLCHICSSVRRDNAQLCIVENMLDMMAIESAGVYGGKYFILHGRISPLDGIGPNELKLPKLKSLVASLKVNEIVMALSPSVEGETTAHFISDMLKEHACTISRIGFGVPFGGELEYLDQQTLTHAFKARVNF
ncbi:MULTISPECIES: recombination mediator RecR [unclassified Cysteiniphilum]|uniref:recombination mediator RecR n=1 Tax=unclassified Cysteiniphilum TaxID=2610889 RepID=UPI001247C9F7|nr:MULTISPECIES: recombination mediator RecR [unclassified Cysteiniphilum]WHN66408.1 recombination mediator RecR [Cysteiniphilum sp. QT6929]